jgi:hypothetical protein
MWSNWEEGWLGKADRSLVRGPLFGLWREQGSNSAPARRFYHIQTRPDRLWGPPSLYCSGKRGSFLVIKQPECDVTHSPASSAETENWCSYTCALPLFLYGICGTNLPNSMKQSLSGEANISPAGQKIPCVLSYPEVHRHVPNGLTVIPVLKQISWAYALPTDSFQINFDKILTYTISSSKLSFSFKSYRQPCAHLFSFIRATCAPHHRPWLDIANTIVICTIPGPVTSYRSDPHMFLNPLFSNCLKLHSALNVRDQFSDPYKALSKSKICVF